MTRSAVQPSAAVVWDAVRKFDAHMVKTPAATFSTDKLNLTGLHSYSASGLAQAKALGIARNAKGKLVATVRVATSGHARSKVVNAKGKSKGKAKGTPVAKGTLIEIGLGGGGKKAVKAVETLTVGNSGYRADLQKAALARFSRLTRIGAPKKQ